MALSSPGIGSGLDVRSIVSQLVELEKRPLAQLQTAASGFQARLSAIGQLRSQFDNLQTQASRLANPSTWSGLTLSSSNSAVSGRISSTVTATPTQFAVEVSQLASAQTFASAPLPAGSLEGTLTFSFGNFSDPTSFESRPDIEIGADDTLADVARKINEANLGISATLLNDGVSGQRLLLRSSSTGEASGFRIDVTAAAGSQLDALSLTDLTGSPGQTIVAARDTQATLNGVPIQSSNNQFDNVIPGVSFSVSAITQAGSPAVVTVNRDMAQMRTAINNFVQSYNALNNAIAEMTRFNPSDRSAGTLQGDVTVISTQNALRRLVGSQGSGGSEFSWLSQVGVSFTDEGTLQVNNTRLDQALAKPAELERFFTNTDPSAGLGFGVRLRDFANGLVAATGALASRSNALRSNLERNQQAQERLTERLSRTEERLLAQYARLDTQLSQLTALGNFVNQQVTLWNSQLTPRR